MKTSLFEDIPEFEQEDMEPIDKDLDKDPELRKTKVDFLFSQIMEIVDREKNKETEIISNVISLPIASPADKSKDIDVKKIRESMGLNQGDFARKLGVSNGLICLVEKGKAPISKKLRQKLLEVA